MRCTTSYKAIIVIYFIAKIDSPLWAHVSFQLDLCSVLASWISGLDTESSFFVCWCRFKSRKELVEVEKNNFIALTGKEGLSASYPQKSMCPNPGRFNETFYGWKMGMFTRTHSFNLASGGLLATCPLISNCSYLLFETQGRSWRLESNPHKWEIGNRKAFIPRNPTGFCLVSFYASSYHMRFPQTLSNIFHFSKILWLSVLSTAVLIWLHLLWASLVAQTVKNLLLMQKSWVWSLGQEDPLENEMATHFSILA